MLFAILFAAGLLLFFLIRRYIRKTGHYQVIDQTGVFYYYGTYAECLKLARLKNIEAEAYDEDDRFTVKRCKVKKMDMKILTLQ